jgi:NAD-dependent dihydropyrimidine dehydrogenase PreA subunit
MECMENKSEHRRLKMPKETWHGIPRSKIPWYPTIDYDKCITCGKCVEYCTLGTFAFEEEDGKKRTAVKNPNNCVVLCTGCDAICPVGAITHPSKRKTSEIIRNLRKVHDLDKEKREKIGNLRKANDLHSQKEKRE